MQSAGMCIAMDPIMSARPPIHKLPVELLCIIFRLACPNPCAVTISHVCSRWRKTALNLRPIWSELKVWSSQGAPAYPGRIFQHQLKQYFFRAKGRLLSFSTNIANNEHLRSFIKYALPQLESLEIPNSYVNTLNRPAPRLKTLKTTYGNEGVYATIPQDIFQEQNPYLRKLSLTHASISWDSTILPNLIDLSLASATIDCPRTFSLLECLASMPMLEKLSLQSVRFHHRAPFQLWKQNLKPAHLPSLKHITLRANALFCGTVLKHIRVSQAVAIYFDIDIMLSGFCGPFLDVMGFISTSFDLPGARRDTCSGTLTVEHRVHTLSHRCHPKIELIINFGKTTTFGPELLAAAAGALALDHMKSLRMDENLDSWVGAYGPGRLQHVTHLGSRNSKHAFAILGALMNGLHACPAGCTLSSTPVVWLPKLQSLDLDFKRSNPWTNSCPFKSHTPTEAIRECMRARRFAGFGIQYLRFRSWYTYHFTEEQEQEFVESLKQFVPNLDVSFLEWDD